MRSLRVALAQVNPTVGDLSGNAALIRRSFAKAAKRDADLVVFPELAITGYPPEDLLLKPSFVTANLDVLTELASRLDGPAAVIGFVDRGEAGELYNGAALLAGGKVRAVYHKVVLPNYGVFDEKRYFTPGGASPIVVVRGVQVGLSVCEDAWVGDGPIPRCGRLGAEVIVHINASPYHMNKSLERQVLYRQRAIDAKAILLSVQTVGGQDELVFDGDSVIFDARGKLLARGKQFEEDLVVTDLELPDRTRPLRKAAEVTVLSKAPARTPARPPARPRRALPRMDPIEEVYSALLLGTRDYVRKNGFARAFIGLSGGIDSSLTAVVATDALGAENVTGVAMPSPYSSDHSLEDAKALATNLGIDFRVIPIDDAFASFLDALRDAFEGTRRDTTEENLQARIRGTILMAFSNKFQPSLVLTTGNKSEMAVGYSTLYGDMAGGFSVLKDVPKTLVYELAAWRNAYGIAAIPERVFTKAPSAELRPDQKDSDALPPYETLDPILRAYVEDDRSVRDMIEMGFPERTVRRIVELVDRSEYKRRQAPPGIKITHRAFGKDWRLPITNRFRPPKPPGRRTR